MSFLKEKNVDALLVCIVVVFVITLAVIFFFEKSKENTTSARVKLAATGLPLPSTILSADNLSPVLRKWYKIKGQVLTSAAPNEADRGPKIENGEIIFTGTPWDHSLEKEEKTFLTLKRIEIENTTFSFHVQFTFTSQSYGQRVFEFQNEEGIIFSLYEEPPSSEKKLAFSVMNPNDVNNSSLWLLTPNLMQGRFLGWNEKIPENLVDASFSVWGSYDLQSGRAILYGFCDADNYGSLPFFGGPVEGVQKYGPTYFAVSYTKKIAISKKTLVENHVGHTKVYDSTNSATNMKLRLLQLPILAGLPGLQRFFMCARKINGLYKIYGEPAPVARYWKRAGMASRSKLEYWDDPTQPRPWICCQSKTIITDKSNINTECDYIGLAPVLIDFGKPLIISVAFNIVPGQGWDQRILELRSWQNPDLLISIHQHNNTRDIKFVCVTSKGTYHVQVGDVIDESSHYHIYNYPNYEWSNAYYSTFATITKAGGMKLQVNGKVASRTLPDDFYNDLILFDLCTLCGTTLDHTAPGTPSFTNALVQHIELVNDIDET